MKAPKEDATALSPRTMFWAKKTGNYWLSNFYPAPIEHDGAVWPSSEHLYQALKCPPEYRERIRNEPKPADAKKLARMLQLDLDIVEKARLMRIAIGAKFAQHPDLKEMLLATKGAIVEVSPSDSLWGEGPDGDGLDLMGLLLTEHREKLRHAPPSPPSGASTL